MHCVNPLTIQFRARTPAICSVPSASSSPARFASIRGPNLYHLSSRMKGISCSILCQNLPQRCSGGEKMADGVWDWEQVNDDDNEERRNPGHSRPFQMVESRRAAKHQVCWRSAQDVRAWMRACSDMCGSTFPRRVKSRMGIMWETHHNTEWIKKAH